MSLTMRILLLPRVIINNILETMFFSIQHGFTNIRYYNYVFAM